MCAWSFLRALKSATGTRRQRFNFKDTQNRNVTKKRVFVCVTAFPAKKITFIFLGGWYPNIELCRLHRDTRVLSSVTHGNNNATTGGLAAGKSVAPEDTFPQDAPKISPSPSIQQTCSQDLCRCCDRGKNKCVTGGCCLSSYSNFSHSQLLTSAGKS